ncbi:DUF1569 domain-containing protein [Seonamhaeicola maritimus]|uniref:DUF1569 domain-containing protein n=1 Tax=Seonamhaeicola maritimus TaxID=2591822 RepID=A0A5C7GLF5_9FLAO|nr:DUF1569 domain-containing protein [Seonamhaeicola maritimus]TXG38781.1 DUF1569 domain-containing protein [Seonamhaeicola maritimus]
MKSLFEADTHKEILNRINKLKVSNKPHWGKMSVSQMVKHCHRPIEVAMGTKELSANLGFMKKMIFKLFKSSLYNNKPWKEGIPTAPEYVVRDNPEFKTEKERLQTLVNEFHSLNDKTDWAAHPLFGNLSKEQWGKAQYKHLDHHLRQFGV